MRTKRLQSVVMATLCAHALGGCSCDRRSADSAGDASVDADMDVPAVRVFDGPRAGARFGVSVSLGPDADGDGRGDLLVGAPFVAGVTPRTEPGEAYLFSGRTGALLHSWVDDEVGAEFGYCVVLGSDTDGDGLADVLVSAPAANALVGRVYLYSGRTGALLHVWDGEAGGAFGLGCAMGPDVDGDGRGDVAIGANTLEYDCKDSGDVISCRAGRAYLYSGRTGLLLRSYDAPDPDASHFGRPLAFAGDLNGDGAAELLISEPDAASGRAHAVTAMSGVIVRTWEGAPGSSLGTTISAGTDADGDGVADVLLGSYVYSGSGRVELYSGAGGDLRQAWDEAPGDWAYGAGLSLGPDADGDGLGDVLIGVEPLPGFVGSVILVSGYSGAEIGRWDGETMSGAFGGRVSLGPDINGDGLADFAVGAYNASYTGEFAGRVYLFVSN